VRKFPSITATAKFAITFGKGQIIKIYHPENLHPLNLVLGEVD
jgi:hypothetical protein